MQIWVMANNLSSSLQVMSQESRAVDLLVKLQEAALESQLESLQCRSDVADCAT